MRQPSEAQKRRMEEQWGTAWGNILLIHQPTTQKKMPTYKHKPTNTVWGYWLINGKGVYLKKTDKTPTVYTNGMTDEPTVPAEIVEKGNDWEEYDYEQDKIKYSKRQMLEAISFAFGPDTMYDIGRRQVYLDAFYKHLDTFLNKA